jgi:hypothetical protein
MDGGMGGGQVDTYVGFIVAEQEVKRGGGKKGGAE